jgi:hypothetical protein
MEGLKKNKGCMILMKQNERLVEEMPSLMQIQYVLNTLRFFFLHQKNVTTLSDTVPQRS